MKRRKKELSQWSSEYIHIQYAFNSSYEKIKIQNPNIAITITIPIGTCTVSVVIETREQHEIRTGNHSIFSVASVFHKLNNHLCAQDI